MVYQKLEIDGDEELARLIFRDAEGVIAPDECAPTDLERRPWMNEGGLSFSRSGLITYRGMVAPKKRNKRYRFGIATIKAGEFLRNGYTIMFDPDTESGPQHVCVHCPSCNLWLENCECSRPAICPFVSEESDEYRAIIGILMDVPIPALESKDELLRIFGSDVPEDDLTEANNMYLRRWDAHFALTSALPLPPSL